MPFDPKFYGWRLVLAGWIIYGFGMGPVYYGWVFFLPGMMDELGMSRATAGWVFGAYLLAGGMASPLIGIAIGRFGLRKTITTGALVGALGFYLTSRSQSVLHLVLTFGVFGSFAHSFITVIPTQTLASTWFLRYRARVMAILLTATGVTVPILLRIFNRILETGTWRDGWVFISALVAAIGVFAFLTVRDSPESMGLLRDGAASEEELASAAAEGELDRDSWTAPEALRTPQFWMMLVCGLGYAVPWYVLTNHSRLHLEDQGLDTGFVATVVGAMVLISTIGRLTGSLADFISPPRLLGLALGLEALGSFFFMTASSKPTAYAAAVCLGLGFGAAYISQASTFALFFGRRAFATTTGVRFAFGRSSVPPCRGSRVWRTTGSGLIPRRFSVWWCSGSAARSSGLSSNRRSSAPKPRFLRSLSRPYGTLQRNPSMEPRDLIDTFKTHDGNTLALVKRGGDYFIDLDGEELMSTRRTGSEIALAELGCEDLEKAKKPRALIGGLGLGFTMRRALELLPANGRLVVAELFPRVVQWNREHLTPWHGKAYTDKRLQIVTDDVWELVAQGPWDAIMLDTDNGPEAFCLDRNDRLYSRRGLDRFMEGLVPGGLLAIWSSDRQDRFVKQLQKAGFDARCQIVREHRGRGQRYAVYLARRVR